MFHNLYLICFCFFLNYLIYSVLCTVSIIWLLDILTIFISIVFYVVLEHACKMWTIQPLAANHILFNTMNKWINK